MRNRENPPAPGSLFGALSFVGVVDGPGRERWVMRCSCGVERDFDAKNIRRGNSTSCGGPEHRCENLSGMRFGRLVVTGGTRGSDGRFRWACVCDCGGSAVVFSASLRSGRTKSCGCLQVDTAFESAVDMVGETFGLLTVVRRSSSRGGDRGSLWDCVCQCGSEKTVPAPILRRGAVISCGCAVGSGKRIRPASIAGYYAAQQSKRRAAARSAGGVFTDHQIKVLYRAQRGRCACCGSQLRGKFHRDHRVALALGGSNDITNIELLCGPCNLRKGAKDAIDWANENGRLL